MLAHLRFPHERSRGRRHSEPAHPYRNPFQRDRDRVIHSRAFRRLERKTQVFTEPLSDHFRNRLTHTIEVSQIARTVALALGLNEDLVEALALAHDIGHPPFGHCGEEALDREMRRFGDRFDHNLHALRIVESFENRYADFPGLNLTYEVREGLVKHSRDWTAEETEETAEYRLDERPLLEAQLIDPADEIAYNCADLDDAVEARILDTAAVRREVEAFDRAAAEVERLHPGARPLGAFNESLRLLIDALVGGLIEGTRTAAAAAETSLDGPEAVRQRPDRLARFSDETARASRQLKTLLRAEVYGSAQLEREAIDASAKVSALFRRFLDAPGELPRVYRERAETTPPHRVVCDYIAGMTDKFLLRRYAETIG